MFPTDKKKLKERINRYRRSLKGEDRDGAGKRFLVGPMFLLLGDLDGAIEYYAWYTSRFPGDGAEPFNHLSWALALYKSGNLAQANAKLRKTVFSNLYLLPYMLGMEPKPLKIWHGSNWAELDYVLHGPPEFIQLWDIDAKAWATMFYNDPAVAAERERFIEIEARLLDVRSGPERTALVNESSRMRDGKVRLTLVPQPNGS